MAGGSQAVDPEVRRARVRLLVSIVLIGSVTSIGFHYAQAAYLGAGKPIVTFLFDPVDAFNDFNNMYEFARSFLDGARDNFIYFPFAFISVLLLTVLPRAVALAMMIAAFVGVLVSMIMGWVVDRREHSLATVQTVFVLVALSYPVLFIIDRANLEMVVFCLAGGFFYFHYVRSIPVLSAMFLAAAIAFKLYPATLLVLLLAERRYRIFVLTLAMAAGLTVAATILLAILGHVSLGDLLAMNQAALSNYDAIKITEGDGIAYGHTLLGLLRLPDLAGLWSSEDWPRRVYTIATGLAFIGLSAYAVFVERERWKRLLYAVVPSLLLPFVSADYTLIWLYFPLVFFLNAPRTSRWDRVYVFLFGVLLVPTDYVYFASIFYPTGIRGISSSVLIYPLALTALLLVAVIQRRPPSPGEPARGRWTDVVRGWRGRATAGR